MTPGRRLLWEERGADGSSSSSAPVWPAERVVFLNDVYFCARDVVRLLNHDADIACGLDFDRLKLVDATPKVRGCWCMQQPTCVSCSSTLFGMWQALIRHLSQQGAVHADTALS